LAVEFAPDEFAADKSTALSGVVFMGESETALYALGTSTLAPGVTAADHELVVAILLVLLLLLAESVAAKCGCGILRPACCCWAVLSNSTHNLPSVLPWTIQLIGSRPGLSFAVTKRYPDSRDVVPMRFTLRTEELLSVLAFSLVFVLFQ
jgi:hypothetical protein